MKNFLYFIIVLLSPVSLIAMEENAEVGSRGSLQMRPSLPMEVFSNIFFYLDDKTLCRVREVSRITQAAVEVVSGGKLKPVPTQEDKVRNINLINKLEGKTNYPYTRVYFLYLNYIKYMMLDNNDYEGKAPLEDYKPLDNYKKFNKKWHYLEETEIKKLYDVRRSRAGLKVQEEIADLFAMDRRNNKRR